MMIAPMRGGVPDGHGHRSGGRTSPRWPGEVKNTHTPSSYVSLFGPFSSFSLLPFSQSELRPLFLLRPVLNDTVFKVVS